MYVCLYFQKNKSGEILPNWKVFSDLKIMMKTVEQMSAESVDGPILTFETNSAFTYNKSN